MEYQSPAKILVVDDERDIESIINQKFRKRIRREELIFHFATNGREALEKLQAEPDTDVVIADINMPEMDGLTLLSHLSELDIIHKTIMISAYGDMRNIREAMNRGAFDFITKPFDLKDLELTIDKTIGQVRELKEVSRLREEKELAQANLAESYEQISRLKDQLEALLVSTRQLTLCPNPLAAITKMAQMLSETVLSAEHDLQVYLSDSYNDNKPRLKAYQLERGAGVIELERVPVSSADVSNLTRLTELDRDDHRLQAPVSQNDEWLGLVRINGTEHLALSDEDVHFIEGLTTSLGLVLANLKLNAQKQLATVGQMASTIIHDLKSPLAVIRCYAELISTEDCSEAQKDRFLSIIMRETDRMVQLVNDILEYARGTMELDLEPHHVKSYFDNIVTALQQKADDKAIRIELDLQYSGHIQVDGHRFYRVVYNIVNNAIEAMSEEGLCHIRVSEVNEQIQIRIEDNGPGIPEEIRDRLFEPFCSHGKRNGTGLGLAIVKRIVEEHGGQIRFESEPDHGTQFEITLPKAGVDACSESGE